MPFVTMLESRFNWVAVWLRCLDLDFPCLQARGPSRTLTSLLLTCYSLYRRIPYALFVTDLI